MDMYACDLCGYYYDPEYGDEENHIPRGTAFDRLPSDWICPECSASKGEFYKLDDEDLDTYEDYEIAYEEYQD